MTIRRSERLAKAQAELRMEVFDLLPRELRDRVNAENATLGQMLAMQELLRQSRVFEAPTEGRLYRQRQHR